MIRCKRSSLCAIVVEHLLLPFSEATILPEGSIIAVSLIGSSNSWEHRFAAVKMMVHCNVAQ